MAITNSDGSIVLSTKVDDSGLNKGLTGLKRGISAFGKAFAVAGAAGAAAFAGITKAAVTAYADYEQLVGGVETLFKDSADIVKGYADMAYQTAGLSANEYMNTVTSFSASLLQSLGGDTQKSAEYANQAIIDMSDNANKMGTSMEMIQNAYQGFAKQNYTMLDNLKLGYGGTKEEMQRLLDDASKLAGIEFDISSFADITEAIHVVQTEMGITGTTAKEASTTIQGSISAMKGSWENLLVAFADPEQDVTAAIDELIASIGVVADNLLPRIGEAFMGIFSAIPTPILVVAGAIGALAAGIAAYNAVVAIKNVLDAVQQAGTVGLAMAQIGLNTAMLASPITWVVAGIVALVAAFVILWNKCDGFRNFWIGLWEAIKAILAPVIEWLKQAFLTAWDYIKGVWEKVQPFFAKIWEGIKQVFSVVSAVLGAYFQTAWAAIQAVWNVVVAYFTMIWNNIKLVFSAVKSVLSGDFKGAWEAIKQIWGNVKAFFGTVWENIKSVFSTAWQAFGGIAKDMIDGLWQGISKATDWLLTKIREWCGSILNGIKAFFGIKSPSRVMRDEVGKMIPKGMAIGIDMAKKLVTNATKALVEDTRSEVQKVLDDMNKEILESEKKYAEESERLKDSKSKADKAYLEELKKNAEKERKIHDARQKDVENLKKNIVNAYSDMADEAMKSIDSLLSQQEKLAERLSDFGSVMEDVVEIEDKFSNKHSLLEKKFGTYFFTDLESQTRELERYSEIMFKLRDREGMSAELFDVIKNMNYEESFAFAKKLIQLNDKQFNSYIEKWQKKQETTKKLSEELFGGGYTPAKRVLSDLTAQTQQLKEYYTALDAVKQRGGVPQKFFADLRDMGVEEGLEYANALLELSDEGFRNYIKEWQNKQELSKRISKELYADEADELADEIRDKFVDVENEFFSIGEKAESEFESGFMEQLQMTIGKIRRTISGAFGAVQPMSGGYSINVPALARGSVLPGGKPFLAIVNDQPKGQTNVEAPLQTIVDAMNISLRNNGVANVVKEEHYYLDETELMTILHKLVKGGERLQGTSLLTGGVR